MRALLLFVLVYALTVGAILGALMWLANRLADYAQAWIEDHWRE